jgi:hypothetical protein
MNATFGIDLDALIGGDFKADDGWARPLPSRTQFPACPDCNGELAVFDRRYEGGDPVPGCWRRGRHLRLRLAFDRSSWRRRGHWLRRRRYPVGRLRGHTTPERNHTVIVDEQLKNWSPTGQPS